MKILIGLILLSISCFAVEPNKEITNFEARLEYARILSYQKRYDESLKEYRKLFSADPSSIIVQTEMAQILYYQGKPDDALLILEKIPTKELNEKTLLIIGDIALSLKDYPKAESIYREHLRQNPEDDAIKFKLAELLSWQKKYEESIQFYREILKNHPDDIQIRRKYAMALMWMGNDSEAAVELKKTLND